MVAMNNSASTLPSRPRHGMGALFVIAVGVIVVIAAIVGINQYSSLTGQTRDTTAAIEISHKTTLVAESAVDEGAYGTLALDLNNPDAPAEGIYMKIRQWLPPADPNTAPAKQEPVFEGATPFIFQSQYAPMLTYEAMKADEALKLSSYDPESNPVYYGPLTMNPLTSQQSGSPLVLMPESNESMGVMGFAHTVFAKGAGFFKDLDQSVQFSRPYKCLLMAPPWPYTKYALFVLEFYGETSAQLQQFKEALTLRTDFATNPTGGVFQRPGPVKSAFAAFYRKTLFQTAVVKMYSDAMTAASLPVTPIPTSGINIDLNSPIVFEGTNESSVLDPVINSDPGVAAIKTEFPPTTGASEDIGVAAFASVIANARTDTAALDAMVTKLTNMGNALKGIADKIKVRNVTPADHAAYFKSDAAHPAFNTIVSQAWMARATRLYKGPQDLKKVMNKDQTQFNLDGVYYFQGPGPYTLDKGYVGKGILVFEDTVTVSNFAPGDAANDHAVVVAVPPPGRSDAVSIQIASEVTADLVAPFGTVTAAGANAIPTQLIHGSVIVRFLADASTAATGGYFENAAAQPMFPNIDRGNKAEYGYEPPKPGAGYDAAFAKHMRVFYDPGYVKKLYWSKRDRM